MKKSTKITLTIIGSIVGLVLLVFLAFIIMMKQETKNMANVPTGLIVDNIYAVNDVQSNLYLIKSDSGYIAIDAGTKEETIAAELEKLNILPTEVEAVLLTHSDHDHVGGVALFDKAKIYLSKDEEQLINGTTNRFFGLGNKLDCNYLLMEDGQILGIGGKTIKCIANPGHTPGSMAFLINDIYLFIGDGLSLNQGKVGLFNDLFNMDSDLQELSLKKMAQLSGVQYIFTAHYGYTDDFQAAFEKYINQTL